MHPQNGKLKKEMLGEFWNIEMKQNIDLLSSINKEGIKTIAFKAETDASVAVHHATNLLERKGVDAVCLNVIDDTNPFGSENNAIEFITSNSTVFLAKADKFTLSLQLLDQAMSV
jgi:phosphopantothenoylcysteine decarboxylase/phosphopantothenate--cysteine ligase